MTDSADRARIEALLDLRRWDEAVALSSALVAADPQDADLLFAQARAFFGAGRMAEAIAAAHAARAVRPAWDAPMRLEARALGPNHRRAALALARGAVELEPFNVSNWTLRAHLAAQCSFLREAVEAATEARRLAPMSVEAINASGVVALRLKSNVEAEDWFRRGLEVDPANPTLLNNLGLAVGRTGREAEAMDLLERSLALAPDSGHAWRNLGATSARAVWRGGAPYLFFGSVVVLMVGLASTSPPVLIVGAFGLAGTLTWITRRRRRLSAARQSALRASTRRGLSFGGIRANVWHRMRHG